VLTFRKHTLIQWLSVALVVLFLASFIPVCRAPVVSLFEVPLKFLSFVNREINGFVRFHENMLQLEAIRRQNELLRRGLSEVNETLAENSRLKDILGYKQQAPYKVIVARVIGSAADTWSSAVILDKGRSNGVRKGQVAVTYAGLAGRVVEVSDSTSKVMLMNDPDLSVSCIDQRSRQEGLVSGTLGNTLVMKYISKDADIAVGDTIVTSGLTEAFPKGILVGEVREIGEEFSGLSRYAVILPAANLANLEEVLVIIP